MVSRPPLAVLPVIFLTIGLLSGCAAADDAAYPSLAPRPIEARFNTPPAEAPAAPPMDASADDTQKLARLSTEIAAARTAFDAARPDAERMVAAAGKAQGSDAWAAAVQALSRLDALRSRTGEAAASLSDLGLKLVQAGASAGAYSALQQQADTAIDQAQAETRRQADIISSLSSQLAR